jgi:hypothetical protein
MQRDFQLLCFRCQQHFQAFCYRTNKHRLAILRAENEVIFQRKYCASVACLPVMFHAQSIAVCSMNNNYLTQRGRGKKAVALAGQPRIPLPAKAGSPLRGFLWQATALRPQEKRRTGIPVLGLS